MRKQTVDDGKPNIGDGKPNIGDASLTQLHVKEVLVHDAEAERRFMDEWKKDHLEEYMRGVRPALFFAKKVAIPDNNNNIEGA